MNTQAPHTDPSTNSGSTAESSRVTRGGAGAGASARPTFWQAALTIARREIMVKLTSRAYVLSTVVALALVLFAGLALPRMGEIFSSEDTIAVTADTKPLVDQLGDGYTAEVVADTDAAEAAVRSEKADAAVVPSDSSPTKVAVIGLRDTPDELTGVLSLRPEVQLLDPNAPNPLLVYMIALGFGLIFMMIAMIYGLQMAQSVVEEKQSRIVEIILATVTARAILAGKVIGNSALAFGQVGLLALASLLTVQINGGVLNLDGLGMPILLFVGLFVLAFPMIASLYGAAASLTSRQEDMNQVAAPLMYLVMFPYIAVLIFHDNPALMTVLGLFPFSSPVAVPVGVYTGQFSWGFVALSAAILVACLVLAVMFAARVYERSILRTGKRISWKQALQG